mmetsp:Transcript_12659/g.21241  ORF Transcript_12659/g.21241 Transcript_12659/m.21241 type:complete len:228 (-) Transcript_12659:160-843(-)|eukprot:CAMPEP_0119327314 /NCGR_PEP_ID=MMETSP1333-20130426/70493_1 /TAXON_ID=418940 /ORGANISM="Scyphosphaera apsteinii, Strain RCC1455" /LENGTH=227 /DNA_ID=CAMNT_0007335877 /DNA_START=119 /DNA_END=802 /DNA_ORIENTATION=+
MATDATTSRVVILSRPAGGGPLGLSLEDTLHPSGLVLVRVKAIREGTPSFRSSLSVGDHLESINGVRVDSSAAAKTLLTDKEDEDTKLLNLCASNSAQNEEVTLRVRLPPGERKVSLQKVMKEGNEDEFPFGLQLAIDQGTSPTYRVIVKRVQKGAAAYRAGLKYGTSVLRINEEPIKSLQMAMQQLRSAASSSSVTLCCAEDSNAFHIDASGFIMASACSILCTIM